MKPKTTWVLLANSKRAQAVACKRVYGKLEIEAQMDWSAKPPLEYADRQGYTHSSVGPSQHRMAPRNSESPNDQDFAKSILGDLLEAHREKQFDRLVITAAPHMLGALRAAQSSDLKALVDAEKAVDLTQTPADKLGDHLAELV